MQHKIVSQSEWLNARKTLLAKEKEFSKARDALSAARRSPEISGPTMLATGSPT